LPKRFPNIELGAFMIMPNHTHGIIVILDGRGTAGNPNDPDGESSRRAPTRELPLSVHINPRFPIGSI
jgi:hypothetical protein